MPTTATSGRCRFGGFNARIVAAASSSGMAGAVPTSGAGGSERIQAPPTTVRSAAAQYPALHEEPLVHRQPRGRWHIPSREIRLRAGGQGPLQRTLRHQIRAGESRRSPYGRSPNHVAVAANPGASASSSGGLVGRPCPREENCEEGDHRSAAQHDKPKPPPVVLHRDCECHDGDKGCQLQEVCLKGWVEQAPDAFKAVDCRTSWRPSRKTDKAKSLAPGLEQAKIKR